MLRAGVKSVYRTIPPAGFGQDSVLWSIRLEQSGLSVPKTAWIATTDRPLLRRYIEQLGGFPVVLKTFGGTRGVGVVQVGTWPQLFSLCDYLSSKETVFALREFIPSQSCERLVVLGDSVIDASTRPTASDDFRSDGTDAGCRPQEYAQEINKLAVDATAAANFHFGGVDVLVDDRDGRAYVLEVNCPLDFVASGRVSGIDVAGCLVNWFFADDSA